MTTVELSAGLEPLEAIVEGEQAQLAVTPASEGIDLAGLDGEEARERRRLHDQLATAEAQWCIVPPVKAGAEEAAAAQQQQKEEGEGREEEE